MAKGILLATVDSATGDAAAVVSYDGNPNNAVTVHGSYNGTDMVTIPGWGTFKVPAGRTDGRTTFTGEAGLSGELIVSIDGSVSITAGTKSTLGDVDFRASSSGVKFSGGGGNINIYGGAGNDTIIVKDDANVVAGAGNDLVSITSGDTNGAALGAGADTLVVTGSSQVNVSDYNYYEGDVIKNLGDGKNTQLNSYELRISTGNKTYVKTDKVAVQDNWYAARVDDGKKIVDYFTAVDGNNVNVTKDLSKSTVTNVVDAQGAKSANITLGHGDDIVNLSSGVDTIKIGKASGTNSIFNFDAKEDVFAMDGVKLTDITLGSSGSGTKASVNVQYGKSVVNSGLKFANASLGSFNINDGSKTHKLAYNTNTDGGTIAYTTYSDADWFVGDSQGKTTLEVGSTTHLHDITKYKNITNIKVAADAKLDAPISLTGAIGANNTIDASAAKVGTAVWGFSEKDDSIKLGAGQDTVWFGAGDGTDDISGFNYGTATDSDVLYLKDTQSLKDIKAANNNNKAEFTVGKAVAKVATVTGAVDVAQIKLADEKTYKVAGEFKKADTVDINTDAIDGLDYYAFSKGSDKTVKISGSKDWIFHSLYTDFYTTGATIKTIDATNATGKVTLAAAAEIKGGEGTNNIWTYQANASATVTAGKGTDIIWFAENADKDVHVNNFDTDKDIVKFATAQSLKEIAQGYTFASGGTGQATIAGASNTDSQLILDKNGTINLVDANDKAYKAMINDSASASAEFSTDVNIYAGMTTLNAGGSVEGTVSLRLGKESRGLSSDTYYIDDSVTKFDGSKSTATFWIAGNANKGNEIIGGLTENYLYGGGASSDTLGGSVLAKDTFYFGTGDGVDEVDRGLDTKDTIALWNIADADIANVKVSVDTEKNTVSVSLSDSSTLKLTDANAVSALKNGLTFTSASQTAYTYDSESKTLVKKA